LQQVYHHEQIIHFANTPKIRSVLRRGHRYFFVAVCGGRRDRQDRRQQQLIYRSSAQGADLLAFVTLWLWPVGAG